MAAEMISVSGVELEEWAIRGRSACGDRNSAEHRLTDISS
jgi:hypothetical protein